MDVHSAQEEIRLSQIQCLMNKVTGLVVSGHFPVVAVLAALDVMRLELVKWEFEFADEAIPMRYTF